MGRGGAGRGGGCGRGIERVCVGRDKCFDKDSKSELFSRTSFLFDLQV